jgi:hypothetical protein
MQLDSGHHTLVGSLRQLQHLGWPSDELPSRVQVVRKSVTGPSVVISGGEMCKATDSSSGCVVVIWAFRWCRGAVLVGKGEILEEVRLATLE